MKRFHNTGRLLIGVYHQPDSRYIHTAEDDFWQSVLLGQRRQKIPYGYIALALFAAVLLWVTA